MEDLNSKEKQCRYDIEAKNRNITELTRSCNSLGIATGPANETYKSVDDFKRDWDTNDYYQKGLDTFCPKNRGKNNYQRNLLRRWSGRN